MRISDLAEKSGTPVPTIKFYIRKGILAPGTPTARNQADYGEAHVERLDLVRRLKKYAGLSLETISEVLGAAGARSGGYDKMGAGIEASGKSVVKSDKSDEPEPLDFETSLGYAVLTAVVKKKGWSLADDDSSIIEAARAFDLALKGWPFELTAERLEEYIEVVCQLAELEIEDNWRDGLNEDGILKFALLGTFLFEPVILSLRRMAHRVRILETLSQD